MQTTIHLAQLAERASADPHFLGHVLAQVQRESGVSDRLLALTLDMDPERLPYLRLCGMPRPGRWVEDLTRIAAYVRCDAGRLADVVGKG
jgi:hypothetical protein